ncbi:MAG: ankyrin repeat domain-containing protein [Luteolibacter sp.]
MKANLLRLSPLLMLAAAVPLVGCGGKEKASQRDLSDVGYQLTEADWFRATGADDPAAMDKFLKGGIAIDAKNAEGNSALHVAAAAGAQKAAKFLLDRKVPVDVTGAGGRTPLMEAVRAGQRDMVRWLLRQGADPKAKDAEGYKALMLAVKEGRAEVISDLAATDRDDLDGALLAAALLGKASVIDELTKYGASVYARMDDGRTALMVAAENGHTEAAKLLVDIGANRFTKDEEGHTAAEIATSAGHADLAKMLLSEQSQQEFTLQSDEQIGKEMTTFVDHADPEEAADTGAIHRPEPTGGSPGNPRHRDTAVTIEGSSIGRSSEGGAPQTPALGLVMRHFRQRELPIEVRHVEGTSARLEVRGGGSPREVKVSEGDTIPGSRLKVIRVQRRFESVKDSPNQPAEVSIVEVEDTTTGMRRNLIAGTPSSAHDPVALVEDAATGKRYLASPGQHFTGADGNRYTVADVRPNQIVIENKETGSVQTLPLRGPRG